MLLVYTADWQYRAWIISYDILIRYGIATTAPLTGPQGRSNWVKQLADAKDDWFVISRGQPTPKKIVTMMQRLTDLPAGRKLAPPDRGPGSGHTEK